MRGRGGRVPEPSAELSAKCLNHTSVKVDSLAIEAVRSPAQ